MRHQALHTILITLHQKLTTKLQIHLLQTKSRLINMMNILSKWRVKICDILDNSTSQKRQHVIHLTPNKHKAIAILTTDAVTSNLKLHHHLQEMQQFTFDNNVLTDLNDMCTCIILTWNEFHTYTL